MLTIDDVRDEAEALIANAADGDPLDPVARALIDLAVKASVTSLDVPAFEAAMAAALDAGARAVQVQEISRSSPDLGCTR